jgi:hypothetical protein
MKNEYSRTIKYFAFYKIFLMLSACTSMDMIKHSRFDPISRAEYKHYSLLKPAVIGVDRGFHLLEILPLLQPTEGEATQNLWKNAKLNAEDFEGEETTLVNIVRDEYLLHFLIFAIPTIKVTADIVRIEDSTPMD